MNERPADRLAIAVAQLNPIVGDVTGNLERARVARAQAARERADVVAFSELFIAGYPPEDLVLNPAFQSACRAAVEALARDTGDGGPAVLIGTPWVEDGKLYNAYAFLAGGRVEAIRFKVDLPNYGVFDEKRVFAAGPMPGPIVIKGARVGIPICEDMGWGDRKWSSAWPRPAAKSCWCRTARPIGAAKPRSGSTSRSAAWSSPACRSFISIRSVVRTSWCSTAPRLRSMQIVRSLFSCRNFRKSW